mgnify:CR=1 FL=1
MQSIRSGKVDWTGDNPFIYMKEDPSGDWSSLSLYFRISSSDYGQGRAILILQDPYFKDNENAVRVCLTDNVDLARFLIDDFVTYFGLFRKAVSLGDVEILEARFESDHDYPKRISEYASATESDLKVELAWLNVSNRFAVALPSQETQTQKHEMFCVFEPAGSAYVKVNGNKLPGVTVERDFMGRTAQSASLASSETWVQV